MVDEEVCEGESTAAGHDGDAVPTTIISTSSKMETKADDRSKLRDDSKNLTN